MKALGIVIAMLTVAALAGGGGYWYARHDEAKDSAAHDERSDPDESGTKGEDPVVDVTVVPLEKRAIEEKAHLYGSMIAEPSDTRVQSVPFESRVVRVQVTTGQDTLPDTKTVEVEASPDAILGLAEATKQLEGATREFEQAQQRFKDHLATNQDLSQAQQALESAKLRHQSLVDRGVGRSHQLTAQVSGSMSKVNVQEGQIVPAGSPLVEVAVGSLIEAKLGASPDLVPLLKPGQTVRLRRVDQPEDQAVDGKIRLIGRRVDSASRLVEVRVTPPKDSNFLIDSFVVGEVVATSADGLVVPRSAATPDESGKYALFTIADGRATKHAVQIGLQRDEAVQVVGEGLTPGDSVVVSGNSLLEDGMKVNATPAPSPRAAPATAPTEKEDRS